MRWQDRVYGEVSIEDQAILDLVTCATFQRLKGIKQAGPSALTFPFKDVTRFEHSVGVFILLRRLGAPRREQVAGLLHDVSHTAFSHAVDFIYNSREQDHHEQLKPLMLDRADLALAIGGVGFSPSDFYDDSIYPLLEQPIPLLCADRLDYFLRDGLTCGVVTRNFAERILSSVTVIDSKLALRDAEVAREAVTLFAKMNRDWWAGPIEAFIYNEFADALREAMQIGVLQLDDLMTEDVAVLKRLDSSGSPLIAQKLERIRNIPPDCTHGYSPRIVPKERWLDPPVQTNGTVRRLSSLESSHGQQHRLDHP
jgi:HD superfamily phosphohydrolase